MAYIIIFILIIVVTFLLCHIFLNDDKYETGEIYYKSEETCSIDNDYNPPITKKAYCFHCVITNQYGGTKDKKMIVNKDVYEKFNIKDIIPIKS